MEEDIESILEDIRMKSISNNVNQTYMLAKVLERALLSESDDIYHINGIEFMKQCDHIMSDGKE